VNSKSLLKLCYNKGMGSCFGYLYALLSLVTVQQNGQEIVQILAGL
jgi:hypothetical protein